MIGSAAVVASALLAPVSLGPSPSGLLPGGLGPALLSSLPCSPPLNLTLALSFLLSIGSYIGHSWLQESRCIQVISRSALYVAGPSCAVVSGAIAFGPG